MEPAPRLCALIPVYNHGLTVQQVIRGAKTHLPVVVVDDGSTDQTPSLLAQEEGITLVTLPQNAGKGAALKAGFDRARQLGFTHAVTLDADGQHNTDEIPDFIKACTASPEAMIVGVRDLKAAGAPGQRRFANGISTFWFKRETHVHLSDTQCGYRCYPIEAIQRLVVKSERYAYELEVMVAAAWAGITLLPQPVSSDYDAPTSRMSHFRPLLDFMRVSNTHGRLSMMAFCLPAPLRKLLVKGTLRRFPFRKRVRITLGHLFRENTEHNGRLAWSVGIGFFCGIVPIWGYQMVAAALLAHKLKLNKAVALTASNISFPLAAPLILAGGLVLGHFLRTGQLIEISRDHLARQIPLYLWDWVLGSMVLAVVVGLLGAGFTYVLARLLRRSQDPKTR